MPPPKCPGRSTKTSTVCIVFELARHANRLAINAIRYARSVGGRRGAGWLSGKASIKGHSAVRNGSDPLFEQIASRRMSAYRYRDSKADRRKTTLSGRSGSDSTQSLGPSCVLPQSFGPSACGNINTGWTKILRSETDASSAAGPVRALTSLPAVYPFEAATHCRSSDLVFYQERRFIASKDLGIKRVGQCSY